MTWLWDFVVDLIQNEAPGIIAAHPQVVYVLTLAAFLAGVAWADFASGRFVGLARPFLRRRVLRLSRAEAAVLLEIARKGELSDDEERAARAKLADAIRGVDLLMVRSRAPFLRRPAETWVLRPARGLIRLLEYRASGRLTPWHERQHSLAASAH